MTPCEIHSDQGRCQTKESDHCKFPTSHLLNLLDIDSPRPNLAQPLQLIRILSVDHAQEFQPETCGEPCTSYHCTEERSRIVFSVNVRNTHRLTALVVVSSDREFGSNHENDRATPILWLWTLQMLQW